MLQSLARSQIESAQLSQGAAAVWGSRTIGREVEPPETAMACCSGLRVSMISLKLGLSAGSAQVRLIRLAMVECIASGSSKRMFPQPTAPTTCRHVLSHLQEHSLKSCTICTVYRFTCCHTTPTGPRAKDPVSCTLRIGDLVVPNLTGDSSSAIAASWTRALSQQGEELIGA